VNEKQEESAYDAIATVLVDKSIDPDYRGPAFIENDLHMWPTPSGDAMLWWYRGQAGVAKDGIVYEYMLSNPLPMN
jgi:hypothetical protein